MNETPALQTFLQPLGEWLDDPNVQELSINRPGELWIDRGTADGSVRQTLPALTLEYLTHLSTLLATANNQVLDEENPLLSGSLPDGTRIQVLIPPAVPPGVIVLSFRRHQLLDLSLDELAERSMFDDTVIHGDAHDLDACALLRQAVRMRKTLLLCGSTGSGKTTLLNALLKEIPPVERLCIIEDSRELESKTPNVVNLLYARGAGVSQHTARDLFESVLRLHPDRIICGELRGVEAAMWLELVNSDHPGSLTSIHANGARNAANRLALMVLQAGLQLTMADIVTYVRGLIDVYVQITRQPQGLRAVSEIHLVDHAH